MTDLIKQTIIYINKKGDGDSMDRLSSFTTVTILIVATVIVGAKQYVGQPIQCFILAEMTEPMHQYVENYCYVQNTYFMPFDRTIKIDNTKNFGNDVVQRSRRNHEPMIGYYQWVPFILLLQAALFYAPRMWWHAMNSFSGINVHALNKLSRQCLTCESEKRDHCFRTLADYVHWALNLHRAARRRSSTNCDVCSIYGMYYLIFAYASTKILYVTNAIGQIFLLDTLLQTNDPFFGINLIRNLTNGTEWQQSGYFPRATLCDVELHRLGNLAVETVQCVLRINVFNEKLFIFLWFWTMFVAVVTLIGFVFWIITTAMPGTRRRFIRRLLPELPPHKDDPSARAFLKFVDAYLGVDGVFFIRWINGRVGAVVASKVATFLWRHFVDEIVKGPTQNDQENSVGGQNSQNRRQFSTYEFPKNEIESKQRRIRQRESGANGGSVGEFNSMV